VTTRQARQDGGSKAIQVGKKLA